MENYIGYVIGVIGIIAAIVGYYKSKKIKIPFVITKTQNILDLPDTISELELYYSKRKIQNLSITKIAFFNAGNETIEFDDVSNIDPILIKIPKDVILLNYKIGELSRTAINFKAILNNNNLKVEFDFLDKSDGAIIKLLHTKLTDEDIKLEGTIKGASKISTHKLKMGGNVLYKAIFMMMIGLIASSLPFLERRFGLKYFQLALLLIPLVAAFIYLQDKLIYIIKGFKGINVIESYEHKIHFSDL